MLFPYIFVPHQMDKMHRFINFIFHQVWCRAPKAGSFDLTLFDGNPALKEIMTSLFYGHTIPGDRFYQQVEDIFRSFSTLPRDEVKQLKRWYQGNNDLKKICGNDPAAHLVRYADINLVDNEIAKKLAVFFKGLYSHDLLDLATFRKKIGDIDNHYKAFVSVNQKGKCPFCGISDIQGEYHSTREAYDHYLPKSIYPFNSINFHNLVPACHLCNSSYKTIKDPAYIPKDPARTTTRRKAFYPFSETPYSIDLQVTLGIQNIDKLTPKDITLNFGPAAISREIETWTDVYGIEERYKAKLCTETAGKFWLMQVLDEWHEDGKDPKDFLVTLARQTANNSYADCNFLKKPFLDACQVAGLF